MHHFKACTQQEYETMLKTGYTFIKSKVPVNVGDTIVCQVDTSQHVAEIAHVDVSGLVKAHVTLVGLV